MKVLIDNGHGIETKGKRSPDGKLLEYEYCRRIAKKVVKELKDKGVDAELLTPEDNDISLSERVKRTNIFNSKDTILVSIHINAAGIGREWMSGNGWSVFVSDNASTKSKILADYLAQSAYKCGLKVRQQYNDRTYWTQNLYILRNTKCPAVITENLFMDNKNDMEFLLSDDGITTITNLHVDGILNFLKK